MVRRRSAPLTLHFFPGFLIVLSIFEVDCVNLVHLLGSVDLPIILNQVKRLFNWTAKLLHRLAFPALVYETGHVILGNLYRILGVNDISIFRPLIGLLFGVVLRQKHGSISALQSRTKPLPIFVLGNLGDSQLFLQFGRIKVFFDRNSEGMLEVNQLIVLGLDLQMERHLFQKPRVLII